MACKKDEHSFAVLRNQIKHCNSIHKLEKLHDLLCLSTPANKRDEVIKEINIRHDEIFNDTYWDAM